MGCGCDPVVGMQNFPGDIDVHFVEQSKRFDDFCDEFPVDYLQALGAGGCGHHGGEAGFDHLVAAMKDRAGFRSLLDIPNDSSTRQSS